MLYLVPWSFHLLCVITIVVIVKASFDLLFSFCSLTDIVWTAFLMWTSRINILGNVSVINYTRRHGIWTSKLLFRFFFFICSCFPKLSFSCSFQAKYLISYLLVVMFGCGCLFPLKFSAFNYCLQYDCRFCVKRQHQWSRTIQKWQLLVDDTLRGHLGLYTT